jgi:flagellar basal-body rod protein FlgF
MDGIVWAGSAMVAARTRLEIATENLANASTDGFRRSDARGFLTAYGVAIARVPAQAHGALRHTGRDFDLAIVGNGTFHVRDAAGRIVATRDGAFTRERDGTLRDDAGRVLIGQRGVLHVPPDARVDALGSVIAGNRAIDRLALPRGSSVHSGFLESANVDAIGEMIDILAAERSFESAQKVVTAIDATRQKSADDVARVK